MDDGYASWSILVVVGLVVEFIYHGYLAALKALNEAALEREASEDDSEEAKDLLELVKKRKKIRTCQLTWSVLITMVWGLVAVHGLHEWLLESSLKKAWVTAAVCGAVLALEMILNSFSLPITVSLSGVSSSTRMDSTFCLSASDIWCPSGWHPEIRKSGRKN